jgi:glycosyltransferase involved in cell wall biosynthesis
MTGNFDDSVTVVMPCYNGSDFIATALDSAIAQTHKPVQIVVVDDGSKDASAAFVRQYIAHHPGFNIELIQQPNKGEPAARNTGIRAARGAWVAQLDTDDWWEPEKLEKQVAAAQTAGPDCVMVHTGVVGHFPDGSVGSTTKTPTSSRVGWCTKALLDPTSIGHPSIMVRKDALDRIGGYDPDFKQACDIDLYFRLSVVGTFAHVPEYLLHYRYHAKQMSASPVQQIRFHHRAITKFFAANPSLEQQIGVGYIHGKLAEHVGVKLKSLYWRRNLPAFRDLLAYANEMKLDNAEIAAWRRRGRWPNWLIRLKDLLDRPKIERAGGIA